MKNLNALSISIPLTGVVATYLALGPLSGIYLIPVAFVFWGGFFALGADGAALQKIIVGGIFGALLAWLTALAILTFPIGDIVGLPVWAALAVGIGVAVAVIAANIPLFAAIPATVFGIATSFGYLLQTPDVMTMEVLTSVSLQNSVILIPLSAIAGGVFGLISGKWGAAMTREA
ncbi:DUF1097 domain-containing protein [Hoeflea sp. TYP-13]|uniref:DUF1097 domain-containing protein n=1 Tax=Hoeflea sp. TYP-13 TaxID=3230023 RepID=UPI0034C69E80